MGIDYVNYYVVSSNKADEKTAERARREITSLCESLGLDYSIVVHHVNPPEAVVKQAVQKMKNPKARFLGLVFDELEHCRLMRSYTATPLADVKTFGTLADASAQTLAGYQKLHDHYDKLGVPVVATHQWPILHHTAAQAGFTVCPKICKEFYSPVNLAMAIGAAVQYDTDLWVDCDLWFWDLVPGHSPEEFKCNLLLAYWMGADLVYIEGCGYNLKSVGKQGTPFSLMNQIDENTYQPTAHGEVLRWFCKTYLPANKRPYSFRDIRPSIAIVRFEDTCHGQRFTADWPDNLFGCDKLHSDTDTEAWLGIWNMLTFGSTGRDGLSLFKAWVRPSGYQRGVRDHLAQSYLTRPTQADLHRFFVPLTGTVVFDHTVGYDLLKDIPLLFLTGKQVSQSTLEAIRKCVQDGAVCVVWGPLSKPYRLGNWRKGVQTVKSGKGKFVLTDDFGRREVYQEVKGMIGRPDRIRYLFGEHEVTLWRGDTDNDVRVELVTR